MIAFLKANCLALYVLAGLSLFVDFPWGSGPWLQRITVALWVIHLLEIPIFLRAGPGDLRLLLRSLMPALLFGALYWLPLRRAARMHDSGGNAA